MYKINLENVKHRVKKHIERERDRQTEREISGKQNKNTCLFQILLILYLLFVIKIFKTK